MQSRQLNDKPPTWVIVLETGEEAVASITGFAVERRLDASQLTAIGAFSRVTLGYFDVERRDYRRNRLDEQVEVLALLGDIALADGEPKLHAHVVVGRADGTAWGGHLLEGIVRPTLEVIVTESPGRLRRVFDAASGLPLIRPVAT